MEIGRLLRKSFPFLGQPQNLPQVRPVEKEGGRADALVHPAHRFVGVARVEQKLLRVALAEDVVDHLSVQLDQGHVAFQRQHLVLMVAVSPGGDPAAETGQSLLERAFRLAARDREARLQDPMEPGTGYGSSPIRPSTHPSMRTSRSCRS